MVMHQPTLLTSHYEVVEGKGVYQFVLSPLFLRFGHLLLFCAFSFKELPRKELLLLLTSNFSAIFQYFPIKQISFPVCFPEAESKSWQTNEGEYFEEKKIGVENIFSLGLKFGLFTFGLLVCCYIAAPSKML